MCLTVRKAIIFKLSFDTLNYNLVYTISSFFHALTIENKEYNLA